MKGIIRFGKDWRLVPRFVSGDYSLYHGKRYIAEMGARTIFIGGTGGYTTHEVTDLLVGAHIFRVVDKKVREKSIA
jgi:hypothetical protein